MLKFPSVIKTISHLSVLLLLLAASCKSGDPSGPDNGGGGGGNPPPPAVGSVTLDQTQLSLSPGASTQLTATVRATTGVVLTDRAVSWTSSPSSVASVNSQGRVTAVAPGSATITATSEGKTAQAVVTVAPEAVASVELTVPASTLEVGATTTIAAVVKSASGAVLSDRAVTWSSSSAETATVANGVVTGVAPGEATITATSEGKSASTTITIVPKPVATVVLSVASVSLTVGETATLTAEAKAADGSVLEGRDIAWATENTDIATVSSGGVITAIAEGSTSVTATSEGVSTTAPVTVARRPVATIELAASSDRMLAGGTVTVTAVTRAANGELLTGREVIWSSDAPAVATVTGGVVSGVAVGSATISAASEGVTAGVVVQVMPKPDVSDGVYQISVGAWNVCVVTYGNTYCLGRGVLGSLGNGTTVEKSAIPRVVTGGTNFASLAGGWNYSCAIAHDKMAWCWGWGSLGALGYGGQANKLEPEQVLTSQLFRQVSASGLERLTCGITTSNRAYCWGNNASGGLGANSGAGSSSIPVPVSGAREYVHVSVGASHACALEPDGTPWCWGSNSQGELGDGFTAPKGVPVRVKGEHHFVEIAAGYWSTCALDQLGEAWCWGGNGNGQLGTGTLESSSEPVQVLGGHKFKSITLGGGTGACALKADGSAWCWGDGSAGRNGNGSDENQVTPVQVTGGHVFTQLVSGPYTVCGLTADGLYCWGSNGYGQLGTGAAASWSNVPVRVQFPA